MIYKIISKVMAKRLRVILNEVISLNQSAFIPGRQIIDNVLLAHEITNYIKGKGQAKVGCMAVKLDMSKAYACITSKGLSGASSNICSSGLASVINGCLGLSYA